jgi:hypothetical protein
MITSTASAGAYVRPAETYASRTLTPADALPAAGADVGASADQEKPGIPISGLKRLDSAGQKIVAVKDLPEVRDLMATNWLNMRAGEVAMATEVPDNAPQNIYATVKVDGKVVATLYNGGSSWTTNAVGAKVGDLDPARNGSPPGGPNLAQWRAEYIAKVVGGTIEKAPTAITQSQWTPRPSVSRDYSRAQLDAAFEAVMAEGQKDSARTAAYQAAQASGSNRDISA